MDLSNLEKLKTQQKMKIVGRGRGTGKGGHTVGRGHKGQNARKGGSKFYLGFEGGQQPLYKKMPEIGGFKSHTFKEIVAINLDRFSKFKDGDEVTPEILLKNKILKEIPSGGVKILSDGELTKKLTFKGFKFSVKAKEKIEKSGSKI
jgi:large subunit ribosomal protein L15